MPVLARTVFNYCSSNSYTEDGELREHCVQTLASFCLCCECEAVPFENTLSQCVIFLAGYDPICVGDDVDSESKRMRTR